MCCIQAFFKQRNDTGYVDEDNRFNRVFASNGSIYRLDSIFLTLNEGALS